MVRLEEILEPEAYPIDDSQLIPPLLVEAARIICGGRQGLACL